MNTIQRRKFGFAVAYGVLITVAVAVANYWSPYDPGSPTQPEPVFLVVWLALYLPALVLPSVFGWQIRDFGWGLGVVGLVASVLAVGLCGGMARLKVGFGVPEAVIEAFARTGEEVFCRGYLYFLIEHAARSRRYPWMWAVIGSSVLFTGMHTTAFNEVLLAGRDGTPAAYVIAERFASVLLGALVLGLLRASTGSIIPGALVHAMVGGGVLTVPFVALIVTGMAFWGRRRGESLFDGITKAMQGQRAG